MIELLKSLIRWITLHFVVQGPIWVIAGVGLTKFSYFRVQRNVVEEPNFQLKIEATFRN